MEGQVSAFIASLDTGLAYKFSTSLPAIKVGVFCGLFLATSAGVSPIPNYFNNQRIENFS